MSYFVYILRCADHTLYTGITTDVDRRLAEHNGVRWGGAATSGSQARHVNRAAPKPTTKGAKYTAARRPVKLMYSQEFPDRSAASKEESRIKKLSKKQKEALISKINCV